MRTILLLSALLTVSGIALADPRIIAVSGQGNVEVVPDLIRISYAVSSLHESDPALAKAAVEEVASSSVRALVGIGVAEEDIVSPSLTVEDYLRSDASHATGHRVERGIEFVLREVGLYGAAIQALVDCGVSEIFDVRPDVSDYESLQQRALAIAARNAKANAEFLADQFGAEVERVHQIGQRHVWREFFLEEIVLTAPKGGAAGAPHEFAPGKVDVSAQVYVEFELR